MVRRLVPVVVAATLIVGGAGVYGADRAMSSDVVLSVDGVTTSYRTLAPTVGQALAAKGIEIGAHDTVAPAMSTKLSNGTQISVRYGRPVTVTVDGTPQTFWTTASTVDEALDVLGVSESATVSTSRSTTISRDGVTVEVDSPRAVTVAVDQRTIPVTVSGTVLDALNAAGVTLGVDDEVSPDLEVLVAQAPEITVTRVQIRLTTKTAPVPYTRTTTDDPTLTKGTSKVTTAGVNGVATETWSQTVRNGVVVTESRVSSVVTTPATNQVTSVGSKALTAATGDGTSGQCGASYYGVGTRTANGQAFDKSAMTAAHKTLPFGTQVQVTNLANGKSVVVTITDRGPYVDGRCLDLTTAAFAQIASLSAGTASVAWQIVS